MKSFALFFLLICLPGLLMAQASTDSLWITPDKPQPGQTIIVHFITSDASLAKAKQMEGGLYSIDKMNNIQGLDLDLHKAEGGWSATVTVPDTATALVARIADPSGTPLRAAPIPLYEGDGQLITDGYKALALAYSRAGKFYFSTKEDRKKVGEYKALYWQSRKTLPATLEDKLSYELDYKKDTTRALRLLTDLPLDDTATEADYMVAFATARSLRNKPLSDILETLEKEKFPLGTGKRAEYLERFLKSQDEASREQILGAYKKYFPLTASDAYLDYILTSLAKDRARKGELPEAVKLVPPGIDGLEKASLYNDIASWAGQQGKYLPEATALSKASLDTIQALEATGAGKPRYYTYAQYRRNLAKQFSQCADTYADLLGKQGDYPSALAYEKKSLETSTDTSVSALERYHQYMEKAEKPAKVVASLAGFIERGKSDSAMDAQYVRLYKGPGGGDNALAVLKSRVRTNQLAEMVKTILHDPTVPFTLADLDGNPVSLESLRGKTLVLDFWATWCGPCKRSMPAMQKIVDNHRNDSSVVLLFVDTMEHGDSTKQKVSDFIKNSPYTFHVLLDSNSAVSSDYKVEGIPTKLVIDPQGVLRFKVLGFSGDVDKTVAELETMIQIARRQPDTKPHG